MTGSKTDYKPEYAQKFYEMYSTQLDASITKFIQSCGLRGRNTVRGWKEKYPAFRQAYDEAMAAHEDLWLDFALENMMNPEFNTSLFMKQMQIKFGLNKSNRVNAKKIFNLDKNASLQEKLDKIADDYANNEINSNELTNILDSLQKIAELQSRKELLDKVEQLESLIDKKSYDAIAE